MPANSVLDSVVFRQQSYNMKRIVIFIAVLSAILLTNCKKESFVAKFDKTPQERMSEQIKMVSDILTQADHGWIGLLPTGSGGGYSFYMTFDTAEFVNMYADLTDESASVFAPSRYRIKDDMGADLVFDTYNYITLLNDPDPSAFGGKIRDGFKSDIDFIYDHSTEDSIVFIGKRYRQQLTLLKATAAQAALYGDGGLLKKMNGFKAFFENNPNAYVELDGGIKAAVEPNSSNNLESGKRITFTALQEDGSVTSSLSKFAYTVDQMALLDSGVTINEVSFSKLSWKDANTLAAYTPSGKEYVLKNNPTPILPLFRLWGSKYSGMYSDYKEFYPGTSPAGKEILNYFHDNLDNHNGLIDYWFNYGYIDLLWDVVNKRLKFHGFSSQNGGSNGWTTEIVYNYTVDENGVYKFTLKSEASGGYVKNIMTKLNDFFLNNSVSFDYYIDNGHIYAQMKSVDDPTITMSFELE